VALLKFNGQLKMSMKKMMKRFYLTCLPNVTFLQKIYKELAFSAVLNLDPASMAAMTVS
jgi:hypothetical protein